jgi:hypothetical protein
MKLAWMLCLVAVLGVPGIGAAQTYTIDTRLPPDAEPYNYATGLRGSYGASFVDGSLVSRGAYGQTFTLFVGSTLNTFGMFMERCHDERYAPVPGDCGFRAFLARWEDESTYTGATTGAVWRSAVVPRSFGRATFSPNVWLEPGKYVAYFLPDAAPPTPTYNGSASSDYTYHTAYSGENGSYTGGEFVMSVGAGPADDASNAAWRRAYSSDVSGFSAELTTTPEPASMALLATGLAAMAGAARRRRRREAAAE